MVTVCLYYTELTFKREERYEGEAGVAQHINWARSQMTTVWFLTWAGKRFFSLHYYIWTSSGVHSASYPTNTRHLSLGVKWPRHEADHSPPSSAKVKNVSSYTSTTTFIFVWCLIKHRMSSWHDTWLSTEKLYIFTQIIWRILIKNFYFIYPKNTKLI